MNRNEELFLLRQELESTPPELEYTVQRARARRDARRKRTKKAVFAPIGSLAGVFAAFVLLVNVSPGFAYAAGQIPLIKELAKAVAASPSLSAAVENEYVQPIGLEQTENGITARIEYAIVDQKQVNIFYSLAGEDSDRLRADPDTDAGAGYGASYGCFEGEDGLQKMTLDFIDADVPDELSITLRVYRSGGEHSVPVNEDTDTLVKEEYEEPEYLASLHFTISLDPYYTSQGEKIEVGKTFEIGGQTLTLEAAEIYPTHMRFVFDANEANTAWLKSLEFYVENEKGERFEGISNGISASGDTETPMMKTYMLESAFFAESKQLALYVTGAKWLDKDSERILVDLEHASAEKLPQGVRFEQAVKKKNGWVLYFSAPATEGGGAYGIFGWSYYDEAGTEYELVNGMSSTTGGYFNDKTGRYVELEGRFVESFQLVDYTGDEVWLCPQFSRTDELESPVEIKIK